MIAHFDSFAGGPPAANFLDTFAASLQKRSEAARCRLAEIAALPDGPAVFRSMRASGQIPAAVAAVIRQLDPVTFAKLEGGLLL